MVPRTPPAPPRTPTFDDFAPSGDDPWREVDHWVEPIEDPPGFVGVDPRLLRVGGAALAGVLMIPLALALREDADQGMRSEAPTETTTSSVPPALVADPATTVVTVPITAAVTAVATVPAAPTRAAPEALAAAAPGKPDEADEPECAGTYTVIFNDFWNRFPKTSGASVDEWLAANNATLDTPLYVGDELCIPAGAQSPAPPPTTTQAPPPPTAAPTTQALPPPTEAPTTQPPATTQPPVTTAAPVVTAPPATAAPPPVTTPAPAPAPVDPASVEGIIRQVWPDDIEERALTIARRESGLRPGAYNGHCCYGLFQIYFQVNRNFLATLGITSSAQLLDARTNTTAAYAMYQRSGWSPWRTTDPGP